MAAAINQIDREKIEAEIKAQETLTSGEIVVVVASHCDDYIHVPIHIAAACALAVPLALPLIEWFFPWSSLPFRWIFMIQLAVFILVALVLSLEMFRWWVTPNAMKRKYASRFAAAEFLALDLHRTSGRTGVLIFVALRERYIEIIADVAAADHVSNGDWQKIIDDMLPLLRKEQTTDALILGVGRCGEALAQHFPPRARNPNELPNKVVLVDQKGTATQKSGGHFDPGD